ncbi:MAG: cell division protein FtsA [bacterium]
MARQIAAGVDIGTAQIKVVIAEEVMESGRAIPRIIGVGVTESKGVERGYITDTSEASQSILSAVGKAEKMAGEKIRRAYFSTGGVGLDSLTTTGSVIITRADLEITERDLELALEAAETAIPNTALLNRKVINSIPLEYKIDGKPAWGRVEGLKAQKLEVKVLFITAIEHHLQDTIKAAELAGLETIDLVASPVAGSFVTLSKRQKKAGCVLVDIGAETLSMVVFENDNLTSLEVFPIGGADITNDIALGLKIPLEEAENIKLGGLSRTTYSRKKLDEVISARLSDCFELVQGHLKKIGRDALLPAGVILTGGGAGLESLKEQAQEALMLPSQIAEIHFSNSDKGRVKDHIWSVACGLSIVGFNADNEQTLVGEKNTETITNSLKRSFRKVSGFISRFLP